MPQVWFIAGPNGSGKSTLTHRYFFARLEVIDPDMIARNLNSEDPAAAAVSAGKLALRAQWECLDAQQDFALETTLSGKRELVLMRTAHERGYKVNLIYVCTDSPLISLGRIRQRVQAGGHSVPAGDVRRRYGRSLEHLDEAMRLADRTLLVDNTGERFRLILVREHDGIRQVTRELPGWVCGISLGAQLPACALPVGLKEPVR